jgi:hypothetical protein
MLTVLGGLAEFERELIFARTGDGRARGKARACVSAFRLVRGAISAARALARLFTAFRARRSRACRRVFLSERRLAPSRYPPALRPQQGAQGLRAAGGRQALPRPRLRRPRRKGRGAILLIVACDTAKLRHNVVKGYCVGASCNARSDHTSG